MFEFVTYSSIHMENSYKHNECVHCRREIALQPCSIFVCIDSKRVVHICTKIAYYSRIILHGKHSTLQQNNSNKNRLHLMCLVCWYYKRQDKKNIVCKHRQSSETYQRLQLPTNTHMILYKCHVCCVLIGCQHRTSENKLRQPDFCEQNKL